MPGKDFYDLIRRGDWQGVYPEELPKWQETAVNGER